jgi:hypothetical protein
VACLARAIAINTPRISRNPARIGPQFRSLRFAQ